MAEIWVVGFQESVREWEKNQDTPDVRVVSSWEEAHELSEGTMWVAEPFHVQAPHGLIARNATARANEIKRRSCGNQIEFCQSELHGVAR